MKKIIQNKIEIKKNKSEMFKDIREYKYEYYIDQYKNKIKDNIVYTKNIFINILLYFLDKLNLIKLNIAFLSCNINNKINFIKLIFYKKKLFVKEKFNLIKIFLIEKILFIKVNLILLITKLKSISFCY